MKEIRCDRIKNLPEVKRCTPYGDGGAVSVAGHVCTGEGCIVSIETEIAFSPDFWYILLTRKYYSNSIVGTPQFPCSDDVCLSCFVYWSQYFNNSAAMWFLSEISVYCISLPRVFEDNRRYCHGIQICLFIVLLIECHNRT